MASYCLWDCMLPLLIARKNEYLNTLTGMSRVTYVTMNDLLGKGEQNKVFSQEMREFHQLGYLLTKPPPNHPLLPHSWDKAYIREWKRKQRGESFSVDPVTGQKMVRLVYRPNAKAKKSKGKGRKKNRIGPQFQGGCVLVATRGIYLKMPVAVLDFSSLYPSVIIAENLCYTTLVLEDEFDNLPGIEYKTVTIFDAVGKEVCTARWVVNRPGIVPKLLVRLLAERKQAKKEMNSFPKGSFEYMLKDKKQNGLKVSCNAMYGFMGAGGKSGLLPCLPIALYTTHYGRRNLQESKRVVEAAPFELVLPDGSKKEVKVHVVYGDTDSIFMIARVDDDWALKVRHPPSLGSLTQTPP